MKEEWSQQPKLPLWSQHKRLLIMSNWVFEIVVIYPLKWMHTIFTWLPVKWQFLYCLESLWGDSDNTKTPVLLPSCLQSFTFPSWKRVFHLGRVKAALLAGYTSQCGIIRSEFMRLPALIRSCFYALVRQKASFTPAKNTKEEMPEKHPEHLLKVSKIINILFT